MQELIQARILDGRVALTGHTSHRRASSTGVRLQQACVFNRRASETGVQPSQGMHLIGFQIFEKRNLGFWEKFPIPRRTCRKVVDCGPGGLRRLRRAIYSHSWRRRMPRSCGLMVCFGLGRTPILWLARRRVLMYWPAVSDSNT
jgi:hypothetical protein